MFRRRTRKQRLLCIRKCASRTSESHGQRVERSERRAEAEVGFGAVHVADGHRGRRALVASGVAKLHRTSTRIVYSQEQVGRAAGERQVAIVGTGQPAHLEAEQVAEARPHEGPGARVPVLLLRPEELCAEQQVRVQVGGNSGQRQRRRQQKEQHTLSARVSREHVADLRRRERTELLQVGTAHEYCT